MRVVVVGGDGYLGWPMAMRLSRRGHDVLIVDNFARRKADEELGTESLVPILSLDDRLALWERCTGNRIGLLEGDMTDPAVSEDFMSNFRPEAVIHFGEQRSAPYSMIDQEHAVYTHINNTVGTLNLIYAIIRNNPECHLVKLGTMGEYGTPNIDIEEGYLDIQHNGRSDRLLYPKQPGSIYHLSKVYDSYGIHLACRFWGLRATDLNQGVVYGVKTDEMDLDEGLATRFDYDEVWGTALNRFCVQAAIGHPLTVYGKGMQTRGFLDIRDTLACIEIALKNPPSRGTMEVYNQFTEQFSIIELALIAQRVALSAGVVVPIEQIVNPRVEKEEHYYCARHTKLVDLGLKPHLLSDTLVESIYNKVRYFAGRVQEEKILPTVFWKNTKIGDAKKSAHFANDVLTQQG